jgi:hypothetical protein
MIEKPAEPDESGAARKPLGPLLENVTQSATACLVTMVQGNVLALTLGHWLIASRTGVVSGAVATAALWVVGSRRRSAIAALLASTTFAVDYFSHPSHFGSALTEAAVTGLAAGVLSLVVGRVLAWRKGSRAVSVPC